MYLEQPLLQLALISSNGKVNIHKLHIHLRSYLILRYVLIQQTPTTRDSLISICTLNKVLAKSYE